jgi:hypothetical protein
VAYGGLAKKLAPSPHTRKCTIQICRNFAIAQFSKQSIFLGSPRKLASRATLVPSNKFPLRLRCYWGVHSPMLIAGRIFDSLIHLASNAISL